GVTAVAGVRLSTEPSRIRWYGRVAASLAAAGAILIQIPGLLSTAEIRRSQAAERAGNAAVAYSWANAAASAEPWPASPYARRGGGPCRTRRLVSGAGRAVASRSCDAQPRLSRRRLPELVPTASISRRRGVPRMGTETRRSRVSVVRR